MWNFLLLLLSLMTGCEAVSKMRGCQGGWVEFTWKYPEPQEKYPININMVVNSPRGTIHIQLFQQEVKIKSNISLYHDRGNKKVKVAIKQLQRKDFGQYRFTLYEDPKIFLDGVELHLVDERDGCQGQFLQTAYKTAKTTITCDDQGNKYESGIMFFCKENKKQICEGILSTKSDKIFPLTQNSSMSISDVSPHHAGVYWCGLKSTDGSYRTALRKIQLEVKDITKFTRSLTAGQTFTYWCDYPNGAPIKKFICKGEDPSICQRLVSTAQLVSTTGKFSMKDDKVKRNITITVREVTTEDAGTYWCGAESTDNKHSSPFFHRFKMTVVPPPPTSPVSSTVTTSTSAKIDVPLPTTSSISLTVTTSTSAKSVGGPQVIILIVCVAVLLLLLVLILSLIYKRFAHSKNTRNGTAAQQIREDYVYEEIQEHVQSPDSGNAVNTIYATANFPTNPSASLHYSTIKFQNSSDKAGGEALILRPSSSACEYSTVKNSPTPTYYTVNEPSTSSHDPLYSTINKPR